MNEHPRTTFTPQESRFNIASVPVIRKWGWKFLAMTKSFASFLVVVVLLVSLDAARAQLFVTDDTTVDSSNLTIDPPHALVVSHGSNNPLLSLTGGVGSNGIEAVIVGGLADEQGNVLITGGSILYNVVSANSSLFDYGTDNILAGNAYIGLTAGSTGRVTVHGAGSQWNNGYELSIGHQGVGTLMVENRGKVTSMTGVIGHFAGSYGNVTIDGSGSIWESGQVTVGQGGTGEMSITNGGRVLSFGDLVGSNPGSFGRTIVSGVDSRWTSNGNLTIGSNLGTGELIVENGGRVSSRHGTIGYWGGNAQSTVTGRGSQWTNSDMLYVGFHSANGELTIENGGSVSNAGAYIGAIGSEKTGGIVNVNGTDSKWTNSGIVYVGFGATGNINVTDGGAAYFTSAYIGFGAEDTGTATVAGGGTVSSRDVTIASGSGSTGTATVTGLGSNWINDDVLLIGNAGNGELIIENGGSLSSVRSQLSGQDTGVGRVAVRGTDSKWVNTSNASNFGLYVGIRGVGELRIEDGGTVTATSVTPATNSFPMGVGINGGHGTVVVSGSNSSLNVQGPGGWFILGTQHPESVGILEISDGGTVTTDSVSLGRVGGLLAGSRGIATVSGVGSTWTANHFYIGEHGTGELKIEDGGIVTGANAYLGYNSGASGAMTIGGNGASVSLQNLYLGGNESMLGGNGQVTVSKGGSLVVANELKVWGSSNVELQGGIVDVVNGTFLVEGELTGHGSIIGELVVSGILSPSNSAETIAIQGSLTLEQFSTVAIEIGGTAPGMFDTIHGRNVSTAAIHNSVLALSFLEGFLAEPEDEFEFLVDFTEITGQFRSEPFHNIVLAGNGTLGGIGVFGGSTDGRIHFEDGSFAIHYGPSSVKLYDFQAIPEPSSGVLLFLASVIATRWPRRTTISSRLGQRSRETQCFQS